MSDEELIARLRDLGDHAAFEPHMHHIAADRIEQLAATNEALVKERDEAIRRRDAWKSKAEGYDAVRKALREKVGAPWPPNLSRALWAGIAADEKKRADDAEAKLAKAVEALEVYACGPECVNGKCYDTGGSCGQFAADTLAEISSEAALNKGESHE